MSTRFGSLETRRFRPGLLTALVKVAMISTWRGRTFLDDDLDLADVADFVPAEATQPTVLPRPAEPSNGVGHSVAA